jgi:hypothetical protein
MGDRPEDRVIRSYLLGEMTADERAAFQERIFEDDELFARLCEAEDDLTDALASGELSAGEARNMRAYLEASSQQDRLTFAQALSRVKPRPAARRAWQWALPLAACLVLGVAALLLAVRNQHLESRLAQVAPPPSAAGGVYAVQIRPGTLRGAGERLALHIPTDSRIVELRLPIRAPGTFERYRVDVALASGRQIFSETIPGPLSAELPVAIARAALPNGDYEIALSGIAPEGSAQPIEYYYFSVD